MTDESLSFRLLAILFPIFGIVAAGYFYARHHKPEMAVANRLNMDIFVPALVFAAMAGNRSICWPMGRWRWAVF